MINRLGYYIKEGFLSIFTHGFMSFATVGIIVACLLIMGSFTLLAVNVDANIHSLEEENHILAFVDETYTEAAARSLESELLKIDNVESVEFITNAQAMEEFFDEFDDQSQFEGFEASDFRHRFMIKLKDNSLMEETQNKIASVPGIAKVNAHLELAEGFITARNVASAITIAISAILLVVSLFIMSNTIKLTTFERREEIAIMKMVGATSGFIRGPFVFEGMTLGIIGSLTAFLAQWGIYELLFGKILESSGLAFITVVPFTAVSLILLAAFCVIGIGIGVFGGSMAIRNYLRV